MRMCMDHWNKLRARIELLGISHLVAKSGEEAAENMKEELAGGTPPYDPLMAANNMIFSLALQTGGLYLMMQKEDGTEYCPICEAIIHRNAGMPEGEQEVTHEEAEAYWVEGSTQAAYEYCKELGLITQQ